MSLTPSQQELRAQVPLPYVHEGEQILSLLFFDLETIVLGKPTVRGNHNGTAAIFYDPDSADDIDDDDPDEDLDI